MTLNEVINYLDENAHGDRGAAQLSEWLHELRLLRTEVAILEALRDGFREDAQKSKTENEKLRELVSHLMYVKPAEVTAIAYNGKLLRFDEMLAEVGMRFEVDE